MEVAILIQDCGDGSACLCWFKDLGLADQLANDDNYCEEFGVNEGSATVIEVPYDWTPPCGFDDKHFLSTES